MSFGAGSQRSIERKLRQVGTRLRELRDEIGVIDEQLQHLADDAEDMGIRAIVAETTSGPGAEARRAREHVEAMARHRAHVVATIVELESKQDHLLDELTTRLSERRA
jgi:hypothetical protein